MTAVHCPESGVLVFDPDAVDGGGVLRRPCKCGRTVVCEDTPAGLAIAEHQMFPTHAGRLGSAEFLLSLVADRLVPAPGGRIARAELDAHTAERIKAVANEIRAVDAQRALEVG